MGKVSQIYGAESTKQRDTDTPCPVFDSNMDPVHIPVPNSCKCDGIPHAALPIDTPVDSLELIDGVPPAG